MTDQMTSHAPAVGRLVLNDDGHVFLNFSDDLHRADLRRYLESYCRQGVDTVAYCVGDMSWPTLYPSRVGERRTNTVAGPDSFRQWRADQTVANFADEPGGYFGAVFAILHELGKKALASFRMNDVHLAQAGNPLASEFWKQHVDLTFGSVYGYYGGSLNYASDAVRTHFFERVVEFAELYPDIDGVELDAMRSPFFFPPDEGQKHAPLFTELVRCIKEALHAQARRLGRPDYLLSINVPRTPELALECGLDVATWDAEGLFDCVSVGVYQATMDHPIELWKELLVQGTPVFPYVNCSPQTGQYLGLEEYRAAAANALARGADGIYLFNYPCLFELALQKPGSPEEVDFGLPDLRPWRQGDFSKVAQALDEIGCAEALRGKDKRFLFYFSSEATYRHHAQDRSGLDRQDRDSELTARFWCHEACESAREIALRFKIENVARREQFQVSVNGHPLSADQQQVRYAANGRDTRVHTVALGPHLDYEVSLSASQLRQGENVLELTPTQLIPGLATPISLVEIELLVRYPTE